MRPCLAAMCLACLPPGALANSVHIIEVINDTHSRIDSFSMAPAGSDRWTEVDFKPPMWESSFDHQQAAMLQFHDNDGCLRDLRTVLSDGRRIFASNFDLCRFHAYRPGMRFHGGHPGSQIMP
ncbi:hypothetical protein [Dyella acidisoli]|uniref:Uncharacterized protein n=1 Tax=Dyella acidisoli TaxID=1867834 RepID=A0ABQ5XV69_9GAMM|nr:hypothetical protein [Dyella acidisoli]GLQ94667.1 hypothetical protein GCM10007901_36190 [Dyella acidisoli]